MDFRVLGVLLMLVGLGTLYYSQHESEMLESHIARLNWEDYSAKVSGGSRASGDEVRDLQSEQEEAKKLKTPAIGVLILGLVVALAAKPPKKEGE